MKTSNKLRKQLLNAVSAATMTMLDEHCPSHKEGPPETWPDDEKKLWDMLSDLEHRANRNIEAVIIGASRMAYDAHADEMEKLAKERTEFANTSASFCMGGES